MKAAVYTRYGSPDVVALAEVPKPSPKDHEVLIKVHATTVSSGDWRARTLDVPRGFGLIARLMMGVTKPKQPILGTELAGTIEAVGARVTKFKVGDDVIAFPGASMGAHAEHICVAEDGPVVLKPANLTHDEAAALSFGGMTALDFLRRGHIKAGDKVLVNGASGAVGIATVQLAKHFGADVTAVCSAKNFELVTSMGADRAIDYTVDDFTEHGETYDIIVDTVGTAPFSRVEGSLKDGGRLLRVLGTLGDMVQMPWVSATTRKKIVAGPASERVDDLVLLAQLASTGEYKAVIEKRYPIEQIADAHRHVEGGHKRGSVVVTLH